MVDNLLLEARKLPKLQQKKIGSLLGAVVADAAARPFHWVYDQRKLKAAVANPPAGADSSRPEFWPVSQSPYYSLPTGDNSCYADESVSVAKSIQNKGCYDFEAMCDQLETDMGPNSKYDEASRQEFMRKRDMGQAQGPLVGKWLHGSQIKFMENRAAHKLKGNSKPAPYFGDPHVKETDGFCCSLPVIVKYAGQNNLMNKVLEVTTTQSTWPVAVKHAVVAAKIVEAFILTDESENGHSKDHQDPFERVKNSIESEFPEIYDELSTMDSLEKTDHVAAVTQVFGTPCYNPGSFLGAIHAVKTSENLQEAVRKTILAGGCNCSRAFFIGAMFGARDGLAGIPVEWIKKTFAAEQVLKIAMDISKD